MEYGFSGDLRFTVISYCSKATYVWGGVLFKIIFQKDIFAELYIPLPR
jgi:hypothetical protein